MRSTEPARTALPPQPSGNAVPSWPPARGRIRNDEQRARRTRELGVIRDVTAQILSHGDVEALLHTIVARAMDIMEASAGSAYLTQPSERIVRCVVSLPNPPDETGTVLSYGEGGGRGVGPGP